MLHRDEFFRLLDPAVTLNWRSIPAQERAFIRSVQQLAYLLRPHDVCSTLRILLKDLKLAAQLSRSGVEDVSTSGYAYRRSEWRVRDALIDHDQEEYARELLGTVVQLGMRVFGRIYDWRFSESSPLLAEIAAEFGVELRVYPAVAPDVPPEFS
jgi:hypothetical protein